MLAKLRKAGLSCRRKDSLKRAPRGFEAIDDPEIAAAARLKGIVCLRPVPETAIASPALAGDFCAFAPTRCRCSNGAGTRSLMHASAQCRSRAEVDVAVAQVVAARVICGPVGPVTVVPSPPSARDHRRPPPPVHKDAIAEEAAMENKPSIREERMKAGVEADKPRSKARMETAAKA